MTVTSTTTQRSTLVPQLADLDLTRVAGLPTDAADVIGESTPALIDAHTAATSTMLAVRTRIEELLYSLVPQIEEDEARRAALAAKRAVHRLRPTPWDDELPDELAGLLSAEHNQLLRDWNGLVRDRQEARDLLADAVQTDRADIGPRLAAHLDAPGIEESLALAAPDWLRYGKPRRKPKDKRNLRTLYSYLTRVALKTSPFASLTTVGMGGTCGLGSRHSYASTALAHLAVRSIARDPRTAPLLRYRVAPIRPGGADAPHGLVMVGEAEADGGLAWRLDRVVEADHALQWLAPWDATTELTLAELLDGLGGSRPFVRFRRLFDMGLITAVPPWSRAGDPLTRVHELLHEAPADAGETLRVEVDQMLEGADAVRSADPTRRIEIASQVKHLSRGWAHDAGLDRFAPGELLYEDAGCDIELPDLLTVDPVREDLERVGREARPYIFRSHLYDVLLDRFVDEFGAGRTCPDVLGFLMRVGMDGDNQPDLDLASMRDRDLRGSLSPRAYLPVGRTSAPPTAAALFQVAAADRDAVAQGDYRLVINQFNPGTGGLLSRFTDLLGDHLVEPLRDHLTACYPNTPLRELVLWTELNTAQSRSADILPPVGLPAEVPARMRPLDLSDLHLAHDADQNVLDLIDPATGEAVGMPYLGLVPPHLFPPFARLLAVLADPWINGSPHSDYVLPFALTEHRNVTVTHLPRETSGRLVLSRESWVAPVDALPFPDGGDDTELVLQADEFRRDHEMPREVFVQQLSPTTPAAGAGADRKPMFVNLASPLALTALRQWLDPSTEHVRIVEALPARDEHYQRDESGAPRATEHACLLRWTRPQEGS